MPPARDASGRFIKTSVTGLIETQEKLQQAIVELQGQPMLDAMTSAVLIVEGDAKRNAPVDNGMLRNSISHELRVESLGGEKTIQGVVGSAQPQAVWMEMGTGLPAGHARVKMPPPSALEVWARRHGLDAFLVARSIWKRGGLEPRRFLQKAFDDNRQKIVDLIGGAVSSIVQRANGGS